jgi:hypothetical protein
LTSAFSQALAGLRQRQRGHDPGRIAVDLAVMLADGGEAIADLAVLRNQAGLFGLVASNPTAWRLLSQLEGWRHQVVATDTPPGSGSVQFLEARHRGHARVEDRIRCGKNTGFGRFPSRHFAINQAWLQLALTGIDLLPWTQVLLLDGELATAEPKKLRYRLLHVAGRIPGAVGPSRYAMTSAAV